MDQVRRLTGEPILLAVEGKTITPESVRRNRVQAARLAREIYGPIWIIVDTRGTITPFDQVLDMLIEVEKVPCAVSFSAPDVHYLIVAQGTFMHGIKAWMARGRFGGVSMPVFASLEKALAAARQDIVRQNPAVAESAAGHHAHLRG